MANVQWHKAKSILIFNNRKVLVAIAASLNETARISDIKPSNISNACLGKIMSCGKYYFRYFNDNVEIDLSDVGTLKLEEYDKLCGVKRRVYTNIAMNRKNWKYNKNKENDNRSKKQSVEGKGD